MPSPPPRPSAILHVKVVPGASRDRLVGRHGEGVRLQVAAPPERGRANEAAVRLLAEAMGVPAERFVLVSGRSSPRKAFRVEGVTAEALGRFLDSLP
jgi:uncharacterized protein (TIGR00251 family)